MRQPAIHVIVLCDELSTNARIEDRLTEQRAISVASKRRVSTDRLGRALKECASGYVEWLLVVNGVQFVDSTCVRKMVDILRSRPNWGAISAELVGGIEGGKVPTAGAEQSSSAMLFRRRALTQSYGKHRPSATDDLHSCVQSLRSLGWYVGSSAKVKVKEDRQHVAVLKRGTILAAFDKNHMQGFQGRFMRSLRSAGNPDRVIAVTYGLSSHENRLLESMQNTEVRALQKPGQPPAIERLRSFKSVVESMPSNELVAFWDAADVLFQSDLGRLWETATRSLQHVHINSESKTPSIWAKRVVRHWIRSVKSKESRVWLSDITRDKPFFNSGFAVGGASAMRQYFEQAHRLRNTPLLMGAGGWEQMSMNLLQWHFRPELFRVIRDDWNFCLAGRSRGDILVEAGRIYRAKDRSLIPVVHANGKTISSFWRQYDRIAANTQRQPRCRRSSSGDVSVIQ